MKKVAIKRIEQVAINQKKGIYKEGYLKPRPLLEKGIVLDAERTPKWNQNKIEEVNKYNLEHNEYLKTGTLIGTGNFRTDLIAGIANEFKLSEAQAKLIFQTSYEKGHRNGNFEVITYAYEYAEFTQKVVNA